MINLNPKGLRESFTTPVGLFLWVVVVVEFGVLFHALTGPSRVPTSRDVSQEQYEPELFPIVHDRPTWIVYELDDQRRGVRSWMCDVEPSVDEYFATFVTHDGQRLFLEARRAAIVGGR